MNRFFQTTIISLLFGPAIIALPVYASLVCYPAPAGVTQNNDFTVQVREEGGTWQDLFEYWALNGNKNNQTLVTNAQSFVHFDADFSRRIEVKVTKNSGSITSVRVRPLSYGIQHTISGNAASFFIDKPRKLSVECNGDIHHNLFVNAQAPEINPPRKGDPGVTYFGPGLHNVGEITLTTGSTVYIAGGAVVVGTIAGLDISRASIRGRGLLDNTSFDICNADSIVIEGINITNRATNRWTLVPWGVTNSTVRNIMMITSGNSTDGIDPVGCSNLTIDDVFLRIPDDCISVKCHANNTSNRDIMVKNSILWSDAAHAILIGPEGNGTVTERFSCINTDILETTCPWPDYWGVFAITNGDNMTIRNILFEDCRVEDFNQSNLVCFRIETNEWVKSPGNCIKNVVFRNITYNGKNNNASLLRGYDATRYIDSVTFENLRINGQLITTAQQGKITIGSYVTNVFFKKVESGTAKVQPCLKSSGLDRNSRIHAMQKAYSVDGRVILRTVNGGIKKNGVYFLKETGSRSAKKVVEIR